MSRAMFRKMGLEGPRATKARRQARLYKEAMQEKEKQRITIGMLLEADWSNSLGCFVQVLNDVTQGDFVYRYFDAEGQRIEKPNGNP